MTETPNQNNQEQETTTPAVEQPVTDSTLEVVDEEQERYELAMLEAFIQKPSKTTYYQNALQKMMTTGTPNLQWNWSWWSFFGGWAYLLYRKAYLPAFITFIVTSTISFLPFGGIVSMVVLGGIGPYFIIKRYATLKQQVENRYETEEDRLEAMEKVGGFHTWVAWAALIVYAIVFLMVVSIALTGAHH